MLGPSFSLYWTEESAFELLAGFKCVCLIIPLGWIPRRRSLGARARGLSAAALLSVKLLVPGAESLWGHVTCVLNVWQPPAAYLSGHPLLGITVQGHSQNCSCLVPGHSYSTHPLPSLPGHSSDCNRDSLLKKKKNSWAWWRTPLSGRG